ncbi:MAG: cell division protein FtsW [Phycisphaerales bacterium]|nr:MAG: cell division protein FtsW [Phycisphaerales bacterium]
MIAIIDVMTESRSRVADYIAVVIVFLMGVGAVMVFSAGANLSYELDLRRLYDFPGLRQIMFFPIAVIVLLGASCIDYRWLRIRQVWWKSPVLWLLLVALVLLVLVLIPQLGTEVNQARRWLRISVGPVSVSFQPSELAKWTMVFVLAALCTRIGSYVRRYWTGFLPLCMLIGLVCGLIVIEDFGTAAFIALMSFMMLFVAGVRWWHVLTLLPVGVVGFVAALFQSPHRLKRLEAFLYPERLGDTVAYQANQSLVAIGSGGFWGKGLGQGVCKYGHLPEDTTDFVFAIVGEELGLIGTVAVIGLFIVFVSMGMIVALRCRDRFGRLLASGIVLTIGVQAALNIGVVTVVLPTKGIPLPFISSGGTSLLLSAAAVGVLLNIASQTGRDAEDADLLPTER